MNKFYFVGYYGKSIEEQHLMDVVNDKDVILISENLNQTKLNRFSSKLFYFFHQWDRIKDKDPIVVSFFNYIYSLSEYDFDPKDNHYIIFWDSAISEFYSESFFKKIKKKKNVRLIFYIYDQMNRWYSDRIARMTKFADLVLCTIPNDCKKFGYHYFPLVYSSYPLDNLLKVSASDIYFMGNNSDREIMLHNIYKYLSSNNIVCDFNIVGVDEDKQYYPNRINYNKKLSMSENLSHCQATNCILEIMHTGMTAVTARYAEAVRMNKKLLTNNVNIVNEKYFDPRYIKVFTSIEEIDVNWIKNRENVNYNYEGDFSPRKLINKVIEILG